MAKHAAAERRAGGVRRLRPLVSAVLLLPVLALAGGLVVAWAAGWRLQTVASGSMEPTYATGSLLVVAPIDASDVRIGMPIMFVDPQDADRLVTHRVVAVRQQPDGQLFFTTRGDANPAADAYPVPARHVRGRVRWALAGTAGVTPWLQWPRSFLLLVVAPGVLLLAGEARAWRRRRAAAVVVPAATPAAEPDPAQVLVQLLPYLVAVAEREKRPAQQPDRDPART